VRKHKHTLSKGPRLSDEDITMLNTHTPRPFPCCTSSPTQLPRPSRIQPTLRTVSVITPSYDIKTRRISTHWKEDDDTVDLVMVLAPEVAWIMLCEHDKVLRHLFWANLAVYRVGPLAQVVGAPSWSPSTLGRPSLSINSVAATGLDGGFA
jgi:hypothetical protein